MDYFQPIHQQSKIVRRVGPLEKSLTENWGTWILLTLAAYLVPLIVYPLDAHSYKRDLHLNLGQGIVQECIHRDSWDDYECKQCPMELHQHYSKAWRKVK